MKGTDGHVTSARANCGCLARRFTPCPQLPCQLAFLIACAQVPIEWIQTEDEENLPEYLLECLSNTHLSEHWSRNLSRTFISRIWKTQVSSTLLVGVRLTVLTRLANIHKDNIYLATGTINLTSSHAP